MIGTALIQARDNIRENAITTLLAIITTAFSLVILGTFILVYLNLIHLTTLVFKKSHYSVFIQEGTNSYDYAKILNFITFDINDVKDVVEITPDEAKEQLIESFSDSRKLLEKVDFPTFPRIIEFTLSRPAPLNKVEVKMIGALSGVRDVVTGRDTQKQIDMFFNIATFVGLFLIALLIACIILIIHNSIQISIRVRIEEIEILKILGATNGFIRFPFIIEGIVIATLGYLVSLGVIYILYQFIVAGITFNEITYTIRTLVRYFTTPELFGAGAVVVVAGVFSSSVAARKIIEGLDAIKLNQR